MKSTYSLKDTSIIGGAEAKSPVSTVGQRTKSVVRRYENIPDLDKDETTPKSPQSVGKGEGGSSDDATRTTAEDAFTTHHGPIEMVAFLNRDDREKYKYGWGRYTPQKLQECCLKPRSLLIVLSLIAFSIGFGMHGAFEAVSTQLQHEFSITSSEMSYIRLAFYAGCCVAIPFVAYWGTHSAHQARMIAVGSVFVFIGSITNIVPAAFLFFPHGHTATTKPYCNPSDYRDPSNETSMWQSETSTWENETSTWENKTQELIPESEEECEETSMMNKLKFVFALGNFIYGLGSVTPYTMGIVFIDEHVSHRASPVYTGVFQSLDMIGPMLGYMSVGALSRNLKESEDDPHGHWVAWCLPMLMCALWALAAAVIMFGFPEQLAGENRARLRGVMEHAMDGWRIPAYAAEDWTKDVGEGPWALIKRTGILIRQPTYAAVVAERLLSSFLLSGFSSVMSEYIEIIYGVKPDMAAFLGGGIVTATGLCGILVGTYIQYKFVFRVKENLRWSFATALGFLICCFAFVIPCPALDLVGVTDRTDPKWIYEKSFNQTCNSMCRCSYDFQPVCFRDGRDIIQFYSPCRAGCLDFSETVGHNCTCVSEYGLNETTVTLDACLYRCSHKMVAFLLALAWCTLFIFLRRNATDQAVLRFVPFKYRLVGMCFMTGMAHVLGAIPGVQIFSLIMSSACEKYEETACGVPRQCVHYRQGELTMWATITGAIVGALIVLATIAAVVAHMRMSDKSGRTSSAHVHRPKGARRHKHVAAK